MVIRKIRSIKNAQLTQSCVNEQLYCKIQREIKKPHYLRPAELIHSGRLNVYKMFQDCRSLESWILKRGAAVAMKLLNPAGVIQTHWAMNIRQIELSFVESLCWTW